MQNTLHEEMIRERAYALWDAEGRPDGREQDFWYQAERQLAENGAMDISEEMMDQSKPPLPAGFPAH